MITTTECCSECGKDVEIPARGVSRCPECGKIIVPCSSCRECGRNICAYDEIIYTKNFNKIRILEIPEFDTIEELEKHYVPYDGAFVSCRDFGEIADDNYYDCAMCKIMSPLQFHMCRDSMKLKKLTDSENLLFFHNKDDAAKFIDYQKTRLVMACNQGGDDD